MKLKMRYKRIMILGRPGSGKSTFASKLGKKFNLKLYHLEKYFFIDNWGERNKDEFHKIQQEFVNEDNWVIDGNCLSSLEMRYAKADLAIIFYYPISVILLRLLKAKFYKYKNTKHITEEYKEKISLKLLFFIWNFKRRVEDKLEYLKRKYPHVVLYKITNDKEAEHLFELLKSDSKIISNTKCSI
ncbi:MAG: hypothetical protein J0H68_05680 [Sphingobacteriia bacterium]|nr:hypothetical protein [Sphingobacteriia bacterium]